MDYSYLKPVIVLEAIREAGEDEVLITFRFTYARELRTIQLSADLDIKTTIGKTKSIQAVYDVIKNSPVPEILRTTYEVNIPEDVESIYVYVTGDDQQTRRAEYFQPAGPLFSNENSLWYSVILTTGVVPHFVGDGLEARIEVNLKERVAEED